MGDWDELKKLDDATAAPFCINCGSNAEGKYLYPGILRCPSCRLVFADSSLSPEQVTQLYGTEYFFGSEYLNYPEDSRVFRQNFCRRINTLRKFSQGGKLFEIGCAYGFFLEEAQRFWNIAGCDISREACAHARARGLDVTCGEFLELPLEEKSYNVIALWDTIEHLPRPDLYLEKISRLLDKNGIIALTTGDIGSLMAKVRGRRWRLIHPPTHLYYFDRRTLGTLLQRNGIEIIHFEHCGFYRSFRQILYSILFLDHKPRWREMFWRVKSGARDFSLFLNLYDIMMVVGRKI